MTVAPTSAQSLARRLASVTAHLGPSTMSRPKVVVVRSLGPDVMPLLDRPDIDLVSWPHETKACGRQWLLENIPGATGVLVMLQDKVDAELLDTAGPNLRVVSTMSVGYEHVDVQRLSQRGIKLGYTPDVLTDAVADISVMLALMAGRNVGETTAIVRDGEASDPGRSETRFSHLYSTAVADLSVVALCLLRAAAQRELDPHYPHGRIHRLRAHCSCHPCALDSLRLHPLSLHGEPLFARKPHSRRRHCQAVRPRERAESAAGRAGTGERRGLRARAGYSELATHRG
ncbi:hypothetical protein AcV7_001658 [Taiwanofungus camphoratus]|nr:hypothetical protein AcV7_001658 [Antrodia cinnamomea]